MGSVQDKQQQEKQGDEDKNQYNKGPYNTNSILLNTKKTSSSVEIPSPPLQTRITFPKFDNKNENNEKEIHILLFLHGFISSIDGYTDLYNQLASYGFVVIAPQLHRPYIPVLVPTHDEEIQLTLSFIDHWLLPNLSALLSSPSLSFSGDFSPSSGSVTFSAVGHSRGGKIAFSIGELRPKVFRNICGIDPVDIEGTIFKKPFQFDAENGSILILGCLLGNHFVGFDHEQFALACRDFEKTTHVTLNIGHADMLNALEAYCASFFLSKL